MSQTFALKLLMLTVDGRAMLKLADTWSSANNTLRRIVFNRRRRVIWQKPAFQKCLLPPFDILEMMAVGSYETTRCHIPQHMRVSHLTQNTDLSRNLIFLGLKFNFENLFYFVFLILISRLGSSYNNSVPRYATLQRYINSSQTPLLHSVFHPPVRSKFSIILPNIILNTVYRY
jgi:hypothetical protein